jgi:ergothioneine biosynthesis protein EgtB
MIKSESIGLMPTDDVSLASRYLTVREETLRLAAPLSEADLTIQAAEFASPGKWHLAHTTWFFEEFFLTQLPRPWQRTNGFDYLFNSYYEAVGERHPRGQRGLITRPTLAEVLDYRQRVDRAVLQACEDGFETALHAIVEVGLHHEQQHQELFLTDMLYHFAQNPLQPAYQSALPSLQTVAAIPSRMVPFEEGLYDIGHQGEGFGFDNEFPRHKVYLQPFRMSSHLVTNADWMAFMEDGGYENPLLWLSDGWSQVQREEWRMPLYWQETASGGFSAMTLSGLRPVVPAAPVTHISYFEADAYARWAGKRLPLEAEWEVAAVQQPIAGHFADRRRYQPQPLAGSEEEPLFQLYGDVWEWTASPYQGYPRFKVSEGAVGEYNGKFMNNQYVLRGGSCVTPAGHIRATYRNFFYPHQRWQFTGLRLADDGGLS